jgi:hypothetical protein
MVLDCILAVFVCAKMAAMTGPDDMLDTVRELAVKPAPLNPDRHSPLTVRTREVKA